MSKKIEYNGISIEILDSKHANKSEDNRIAWTTKLAAISRGKDSSANPPKRYTALMTEAEGNTPSRPFEFLPVVFTMAQGDDIGIKSEDEILRLMRFCHSKEETVYTNMRALINSCKDYKNIPFNEEIEDFVAFKVTAPMFIWAQIVTHTQLSTESQSDRVTEETEYWLPDDIEERLLKLESNDKFKDEVIAKVYNTSVELATLVSEDALPTKTEGFVSMMINSISQRDVQVLLKALGYPRGIYSRAPYYFKMKKFVITGWLNNDDAWPHFLRERNAYMDDGGPKNWTQPETQVVAKGMRTLIEDNFEFPPSRALGEGK